MKAGAIECQPMRGPLQVYVGRFLILSTTDWYEVYFCNWWRGLLAR